MNKKGIILFDIDRTIFDTDKQSKMFYENISKIVGIDLKEIVEVKEAYKKTLANERDYVPDEYLKMISEKFHFRDHQSLLNVYYGKDYSFIYRDSVFPEVREVLDKLKSKFKLGVFSEGTAKFQNNKFHSLGLDNYFEKNLIFINNAKDTKEILEKIPRSAIVVDDKEHICEFLFKNGIKTIWLNKKDGRESDNFQTIHNLLELKEKLM